MDKIIVVIPYFNAQAQGKELYYSVAGWRKHFKEKFLIVIVGDYHPVVETGDDIVFIECPRVDNVGGEYRAHLDHVNKFKKVIEHFPDMKGFIYTCDDIYSVNDFTMKDVLVPKIRENNISSLPTSQNAWRRNNAKTKAVLLAEGLPTKNYVCHLPVYYEVDKLVAIWDKYDCYHKSYVVEQLYFNTYFSDVKPKHLSTDGEKYKFGVNKKYPSFAEIKRAMRDKIWINNTVYGWNSRLDRMLAEYYGV